MGAAGFEQRVRDLVLDLPFVAAVVLPLLEARSALRMQLAKLHKMLLDQARAELSLRMLEAANAKGAVGVVNVRFEAVRINNNASELLSYGTLVY